MKKLQFASLMALALSVIMWTAGRMAFPLSGLGSTAQRRYHADCHSAAGIFQHPAKG